MNNDIYPHILYEDNHVIGVFKDFGILAQGEKAGDENLLDHLKAFLKEKYKKPGNVFLGLVHRLDRPAGGTMVFAKTSKAASRLSLQFREHTVKKIYRAWVEGILPVGEKKLLTHYLVKDREKNIVHVSDVPTQAGKAVLSYNVLSNSQNTSLIEIELKTGRSHQIRVQLAAIGHPIVGDRKYGSKIPWKKGEIALLAYELAFVHPIKKQLVSLNCKQWSKDFS